MIVKKKDGRVEGFSSEKILNSIKKAAVAVEMEDEDFQIKAEEVRELLYEEGWSHERIEEIYDGHVENGYYTEFDADEAKKILNVVLNTLDSMGYDEYSEEAISTETIQDIVEKSMMFTGHAKTAREYILSRRNRDRIREMRSDLMRSLEEMTFKSSSLNDQKRENANIDGDSSMGTMLRYGSEGAKSFNLAAVIPDEIARAHIDGDIHIHDLDFYTLTETCLTEDMTLILRNIELDIIEEVKASTFDCMLRDIPLDVPVEITGYEILSRNGFVKLKNCVRHASIGKRVLKIKTSKQCVKVTSEHRIPVVVGIGEFVDTKACNIKIGDSIFGCSLEFDTKGNISRVYKVESIEEVMYDGYVYDFETEDHYFYANNILVHNCCQIDLEKLFTGGFNTGHGYLREPGEIRSYGALACIAIQSNQNDMHGGQSIPAFDHYMAPGVAKSFIKELYKVLDILYPDASKKKSGESKLTTSELKDELTNIRKKHRLILDRMDEVKYLIAEKYVVQLSTSEIEYAIKRALDATKEATHQAMEAVVHNLNSMHSRAGAQVPFSSLNFGTDTSTEGRMVIKNFLLATEEGLGNGETPIFPVSIFKLKEGVNYNPGDPNYDMFKLACRVSAKRLFPNFSNLDVPFNAQYYVPGRIETEVGYMGCRTRVMGNVYDPSREITTGRGNLSFTSINLPRLGIRANGNIEVFFNMLESMLDLVHDQLIARFKIQCLKHTINYPFLMQQGIWIDSEKLGPTDDLAPILKHGTFTVGFIGLAECLKALIGKHHGESEEAQQLGLRIISYMRKTTDTWSKNEKLNYSLIATPAEGLSSRFTRIDKEKFGIIPGVTDREYYTNSMHIPVYFPISAYKKIQLEAPYHELCNGGHITYVEMDVDPVKNLDAFEKIVRYMHDSGIGYGAINHPVDKDPVCGYTGIIDDVCPRCGRREGEPMSEEMWIKIKGYSKLSQKYTGILTGNPFEEDDRIPNET